MTVIDRVIRCICSLALFVTCCAQTATGQTGGNPGPSAQFWLLDSEANFSEGVSNNGVVSGTGYYWTANDGITAIGGTPPGNGVGNQYKISDDGARISGSQFDANTGKNQAAYYDIPSAEWTIIGGLGGSCDAESSGAWNITGDGQKIVGLGWVANICRAHAIIGNLDGVVDLGSTVENQSTRANGVDFDGNVVCGWQDGSGRQGAVWVDGVQELILLENGQPAQEAYAVSNDGTWVTGIGIGGIAGPPGKTFRYNTETNVTETIPNLTVGGQRFIAGTAISDGGSTIVGGTWGTGPAIFGNAIIWQDGIGTMLFSDYLDAKNVSYPDGFVFAFVSDMSPDGTWFTGWSLDGNWVVHIPDETTVTPPESFTVFRGMDISSKLSDFFDSDDERAIFGTGLTLNPTEAPIWLIFDSHALKSTDFMIESQAGTPGLTLTVEAAVGGSGARYDVIGSADETFGTDSVLSYPIVPGDHIGGDGSVRARVGWRKTGITISFPWQARIDQIGWIQ